jgi:predicted SprT family Zn-dependent metalloprotease
MPKNFHPRGWTRNTNPQLQAIYDECVDKAIELGLIDYRPELWMFDSTRAWGWARYPNLNRWEQKYEKPFVGLNRVYLQDPSKAYNTICHELAHLARPRGEHHSYLWKTTFTKLGKCFALTQFNRCSSNEYVGLTMPKKTRQSHDYKYYARCPKCGASWDYKTKCNIIKNPQRWSCRKCHVKLESGEY